MRFEATEPLTDIEKQVAREATEIRDALRAAELRANEAERELAALRVSASVADKRADRALAIAIGALTRLASPDSCAGIASTIAREALDHVVNERDTL